MKKQYFYHFIFSGKIIANIINVKLDNNFKEDDICNLFDEKRTISKVDILDYNDLVITFIYLL